MTLAYTNGNGAAHIQKSVIDRLPDIITAQLSAGRQRAAQTAQELTKAGAMRAGAELVNECMTRLIDLAYQVDDGGLCNVDQRGGGVVLIPLPWGRSYATWGLRRTEADVMALGMSWLQTKATVPPLLCYESGSRRWAVNLDDYPTRQSALAYWAKFQLNAETYRLLLSVVQKKRSDNA